MHQLISLLILLSTSLVPQIVSAHEGISDEPIIIRMTENGFEPKEITLEIGHEVLFINNDNVDRWPASNFHPTHTIYSEFDPQRPIPPGESWQFVFQKPGTWRMHDHLIPHMTGTVTVLAEASTTEAEKKITASILVKFKDWLINIWQKIFDHNEVTTNIVVNKNLLAEFKAKNERDKYAWLEERARLENPETAWQYVIEAYQTEAGVVGNPHDMAHLVGQLIHKDSGLKELSICTPVFAFGCYHGLMEMAFEDLDANQYQEKISEAQAGCKQIGSETSPFYWSCIHGMGHGIITYRSHDLISALNDCDSLTQTIRTYCHDGVFMELSISAPANFYRESAPLYPCNTLSESYQTACGRTQALVMKNRLGLETVAIANLCIESGSNTLAYHCIEALGYAAAHDTPSNPEIIKESCQKIGNEKYVSQCLAAAAGELVFQNSFNWQENSQLVCDVLPQSSHELCTARIESVKEAYGR